MTPTDEARLNPIIGDFLTSGQAREAASGQPIQARRFRNDRRRKEGARNVLGGMPHAVQGKHCLTVVAVVSPAADSQGVACNCNLYDLE